MNEFKVTMPEFDELSDAEREGASDNGRGKEMANYIRVTFDGDTIYLQSDAMEPEDCRFTRDLGWIVGALRRSWDLGYANGQLSSGAAASHELLQALQAAEDALLAHNGNAQVIAEVRAAIAKAAQVQP